MRKALFSLSALLLAAVSSAVPAAQSLTLANSVGGTSPQQIAANAFVAEVERRLPNRFKIETKGGAALGGEADMWEAVRLGALDLAVISTASIVPYVPQLGVIDIPFLFRDSTHAASVLNGPIGQELGARINSHGVVFLGYIDRGFRHLTNSKHAIQRPADLAGLKIRVIPNPIYEETFRAFGAEVAPMPVPELYGALRDGRIDGQENPLLVIEARRLDQVQKYLSLTGHIYSPAVILISVDVYKKLNRHERDAFTAAAQSAAKASQVAVRDKEKATLSALKQKGFAVTETVDREAFIASLAPLRPEWEKRFGARVMKRIQDTK